MARIRTARSSSASTKSLILAFLLLSLVSHEARTQTPSSAPTPSQMAKRVDDHYNHLRSLKAAFSEQYEGLGMHRNESGTMLLRKPGRMRWEYSSTPGKLFVLDGKYAWFYAPGDTQVQRIPASQLDDLRSPLRFLLGHTKIESELDNLRLSPTLSAASYTLSGIPKGQQKRIANLSLQVTPAGAIQRIEINEVDGATTAFDFKDETPNPQIPETAFHFTPPPGIPVVDALPPV